MVQPNEQPDEIEAKITSLGNDLKEDPEKYEMLTKQLQRQDDPSFIPKKLKRAIAVYQVMELEAEEVRVSEDDDTPRKYFTGSISEIMRKLEIASSHYTEIVNILKTLGSAKMLVRGNRDIQSVWELFEQPTPATYKQWRDKQPRNRSESNRFSTHAQQINDLTKRVTECERAIDAQSDVIERLRARLDEIDHAEVTAVRRPRSLLQREAYNDRD